METTASVTTWPERVKLRDGAEVLIRPIRPDDKAKLVAGFEQLSEESRYRRFLAPMARLSPRLLRYLTEIDHHDHEALVAESVDGEPVGVARYIRLEDDHEAAELAVAVIDHWQGKGAATELLTRLAARASEEGVERFVATCLAENLDVIELLEELCAKRTGQAEGGLIEVEMELPAADERPLRAALRRAAAGVLSFRHPPVRS